MSLGSYSQNPSSSTETKKIFCAYHKTQFLTNFCLQKQCLMPLCPSCVAEHTQQHYQSSQKPTYVNLNEALQEVRQKCYGQIVTLEDYNKRNDQLIKYRQNLNKSVHGQLAQCKQEIYVKIQHMFQKYQSKILKQIEESYQQTRLYDPQEAEGIHEYINQQIEILYDKIGVLKSQHCLAALIRFYDHEQQELEEALRDVNVHLDKHKKMGRPQISLNSQLMNQKMEGICEELVITRFVPIQQSEQNIKNSKLKKAPLMMTPIRNQPTQNRVASQARFKYSENRFSHPY